MATLTDWATRWNIPAAAIEELCYTALRMGEPGKHSEARVQSEVRLAAARTGRYLFRNNLGAFKDKTGRFVRYGLGNDSSKLNDHFKSADLIGWERLTIEPHMVGHIVARFLSVEVKAEDWKFSGSLDEMAQLSWATLVNAQGGRAIITNTAKDL